MSKRFFILPQSFSEAGEAGKSGLNHSPKEGVALTVEGLIWLGMTLPSEFMQELPSKTEAELYDILAHEADYLPEAVVAAEAEMNRRNLPHERISELKAAVQAETAQEDAKAAEPLGWGMRILLFCLFAGLLAGILAAYYEIKGYKRKAKDCWITLVISFAAHVFVGTLVRSFR